MKRNGRVYLAVILAAITYFLFVVVQDGWQNKPADDATVETDDSPLVGDVLFDREDTLFYKHLSELERYTDQYGLDLDRLLSDRGYSFFLYDPGDGTYERVFNPAELSSDYYWVVFTRRGSDFNDNIAIHSFGGWIRCLEDGTEYSMVPLTFEEPDITVCLNEQAYQVNRKVLALLMEYLEPKGFYPGGMVV